jgi:hypothetical protein
MQKTLLLWAMTLQRVSVYCRVARVEKLAKGIAHLYWPTNVRHEIAVSKRLLLIIFNNLLKFANS